MSSRLAERQALGWRVNERVPNTEYFMNKDGLLIYVRSWPVERPKAVAVIAHGIADHSGRYHWVASFLNQHGISVVGFDHQGHGRSESAGERMYVEDFEDLAEDLKVVLRLARVEGVKTFVIGHSLGGLVSVSLMAHADASTVVDGYVLAGAALGFQASFLLMTVGPLATLFGRSRPNMVLTKVPLRKFHFFKNERCLNAYMHDPLTQWRSIRARLVGEILKAISTVSRIISNNRLPVLIVHGTDDKTIPPSVAQETADVLRRSCEVETHYVPGGYHYILDDDDDTSALERVVSWIHQHA
jgi:alpha-beta hydrolase superfamily lysophospholipase